MPLIDRAAQDGRLIDAHRLLVDAYGPDTAMRVQRAWTSRIHACVLAVRDRPPLPSEDAFALVGRVRASRPDHRTRSRR